MAATPVLSAAAERAVENHATSVVRVDARSGRLVRTVLVRTIPVRTTQVRTSQVRTSEVKPKLGVPRQSAERIPTVATADSPVDLPQLIEQIASEHGVEATLVHSVIQAESNYNQYALSPKGAQGLMQLIPSTAKRFGVQNSFDVQENIRGGVKYLKFLLEYYRGDYAKTIAAYNAGEEAVDRYNGIPPYPETRNYVMQVAKNLKTARLRQAKSAPLQAEQQPAATEHPIQASIGSDGKIYYRNP